LIFTDDLFSPALSGYQVVNQDIKLAKKANMPVVDRLNIYIDIGTSSTRAAASTFQDHNILIEKLVTLIDQMKQLTAIKILISGS